MAAVYLEDYPQVGGRGFAGTGRALDRNADFARTVDFVAGGKRFMRRTSRKEVRLKIWRRA